MIKLSVPAVIFSTALALALSSSAKADIIATIDPYTGAPSFDFTPADYPLLPVTIGDFTFTVPGGDTVIGGTISGFFGNDSDPGVSESTAPSDYFVNGGAIEVAECDDSLSFSAACDTASTPTFWSYRFSSNDLSNLASAFNSGTLDFTAVQNFAITVETGTTTLDLVVAPEPASIFLLGGGLAAIVLKRRLRRA